MSPSRISSSIRSTVFFDIRCNQFKIFFRKGFRCLGKTLILIAAYRDYKRISAKFSVQMTDHLLICIDHTVQAKFRQNSIFQFLFFDLGHNRVFHTVIKDSCRYNFLPRLLSSFQFHCRIHINRKLELKSMVKRRQTERFTSCLVIDNLHIHFLRCLIYIHPVNLTAAERKLISEEPASRVP